MHGVRPSLKKSYLDSAMPMLMQPLGFPSPGGLLPQVGRDDEPTMPPGGCGDR